MFEKEAEEYENNAEYIEIDDYGHKVYGWYEIEQAYQKGAEYGYNKANEWHYVKDGDLPTKELEEKQLLVRVCNYNEDFIIAYYMLDKYYSPHGKRFYYDTECDSPINIKNVIAWKEIVFPELPKESV